MIIGRNEITRVDVCFREPFGMVERFCCFLGDSSKSRRFGNRDAEVV